MLVSLVEMPISKSHMGSHALKKGSERARCKILN